MNFHYLLMSGHAIYLKQLMAQLNHTGLTPGQPKVLDYLMAHDGANQREIADACHIETPPSHPYSTEWRQNPLLNGDGRMATGVLFIFI